MIYIWLELCEIDYNDVYSIHIDVVYDVYIVNYVNDSYYNQIDD